MPYKVLREKDKWAVHKLGADGQPEGESMGEHDSEEEAMAQMRALYANEKKSWAVKIADDGSIEGPGMPFGGPFNGQDLDGEHFSIKTDFAFDWFTERPLLYHHGLDNDAGIAVVGRVKSWETKADLGIWTKAQLDASSEYFDAIKELVKQGKLFFSSGAMRHLVKVNQKSGEITRWPWVELSLTPTPSNLLAEVATAEKHFDMAGLKAAWDIRTPVWRQGLDTKALNEEAFWSHVKKQEGDGHWLWTGATNTKGYGILEVDGETVRAHRVAYEMAHGPIPEGKDVGHKTECATTSCVRASHLELVTNAENAVERASRKAAAAHTDILNHVHGHNNGAEHSHPHAHKDGEDSHDAAGHSKSVDIDDLVVSLKDMPLVTHIELISDMAASLLERTKDLQERRTKEGRMISSANRKRLMQCMENMRGAMDEMDSLLSASEPKAKADDSKSRAMLSLVASQLETLQTYADTLSIRRP